jgi:HlyD family secretion protein
MKRLLALLALVLGSVALIAVAAWRLEFQVEGRRAVVAGNSGTAPVATPANPFTNPGVVAEGRVAAYPGAQVTLSAEMPGVIQTVLVQEKGLVTKGQRVAEIKADEQKAALKEAQARIQELEAEIKLDEAELQRTRNLIETSAATQQEYDRVRRNLEVATAQRRTAEATVVRLEAVVAKSEIYAPIAGVVLSRWAHPGEMVEVGTRLLTLADTNRVRIEAEVDEFDAGHVRVGQTVEIRAEGYPEQHWKGSVEEIPDAVSEKSLKPQDPGRPTDVRVLRVKIAFGEASPLKLGQRVDVLIRN